MHEFLLGYTDLSIWRTPPLPRQAVDLIESTTRKIVLVSNKRTRHQLERFKRPVVHCIFSVHDCSR
jgi:hypothetical protein